MPLGFCVTFLGIAGHPNHGTSPDYVVGYLAAGYRPGLLLMRMFGHGCILQFILPGHQCLACRYLGLVLDA